MIVKRPDSKGKVRYGVRGPNREWGGTFDKEGNAKTPGTAKWKEAQMFGADTPQTGLTCGDFARRWLAQDCPRLSGRTLKSETLHTYRYHIGRFIKDFDGQALTAVKRDGAFEWAQDNKHCVQFVRALFAHALDLGLIDSNPFAKLGIKGSRGRKDKAPPTEVELSTLLSSCDVLGKYGPQFRAFLNFQAYTGMRPGETFVLEWKNRPVPKGEPPMSYIDGDHIHVKRRLGRHGLDVPKSNVERTILLPPPAREALGTFPRNLDLVFRSTDGVRLSTTTTHGYFKDVREEAGLPDVDLYDLRHHCGHHLYVGLGLPARVVAAQLGHSDGGRLVEALYGHGSVGALEELEEAWANVG